MDNSPKNENSVINHPHVIPKHNIKLLFLFYLRTKSILIAS